MTATAARAGSAGGGRNIITGRYVVCVSVLIGG